MKRKYLWKSMAEGLRSGMGDMKWEIGKWYKHDKLLEMCKSGFHASERVIDSMGYVNMENLAKVEVRGKHLEQPDKQCWSEMRVVKAWKWEKKDSVALAICAAELMIGDYEKEHPKDDRPRKAIEAAKEWLKNPTEENRSAAGSAAWSAASSAARSAAWSARSAASSAAESAWSAASSAARSAWSAASSAARSALSAANEKILDKIEGWIQKRIKTLEEIT